MVTTSSFNANKEGLLQNGKSLNIIFTTAIY